MANNKTKLSKTTKAIRVQLKDGDDTKVKVSFSGGAFTPAEFTSIFMAVLEEYTKGLLEKNTNEQVYEHWNNVFGIFLHKIVPQNIIYEKDASHKEFKKHIDETLGRKLTKEDVLETESNRVAAYILLRDILTNDLKLDEHSADVLINKKLGTLKAPGLDDLKKA